MQHKDQHYIPSSYLKAWCDPDTPSGQEPYVWIFTQDGRETRKKAPHRIFYEKDFYTVKGPDGARDLVFEKGLSELESAFTNLRRKVLTHRKRLSNADKLILCTFTAAMYARTKARREHIRCQWQKVLDVAEKDNANLFL